MGIALSWCSAYLAWPVSRQTSYAQQAVLYLWELPHLMRKRCWLSCRLSRALMALSRQMSKM
jgi:hypothetical protein